MRAKQERLDATLLWSRVPRARNRLTAPISLASSGAALSVTFSPRHSSHVIIGGSTGTGKSTLLRLVVAGILRQHGPERVQVAGVDPKRAELSWLAGAPHLIERVATDDDAATLFWKITDPGVKKSVRFYDFLQHFRQHFKEQNAEFTTHGHKDFFAVIDGQQRLTALYLGSSVRTPTSSRGSGSRTPRRTCRRGTCT